MDRDFISGAVGAFFGTLAGQPFDTVKARMQISREYCSVAECAIKTVRYEGVRVLFKGFSPALTSAVVENTVLWTVHGVIVRKCFENQSGENKPSVLQQATVGALSGFFSGTAIGPAEIIKVRLQTRHSDPSNPLTRNPIFVISELWRMEGYKGFTRGLVALWMRDVPFYFVFFGTYDLTLGIIAPDGSANPIQHAICGSLSGAASWSVVFPMDVLKTKAQVSEAPITLTSAFSETYRVQGVKGFYRGWISAVLRGAPANGSLLLGISLSNKIYDFVFT
mmetsp:Transcript_33562/g.41211  ORF Transcript_33562/g.41211 Transcript_33562/m.41211 type:complete len:279 (+) Transcript_33562:77-913(+)